ncbi:hypothetical protein BVG16_22820 [Paenibacillus selenitireducens]|uniref:VOC domain-containing protein n=1 Tax=Paenibacillus selenitireducens TaxID=1324314 RepID=A0A1T2X3X4_9BACL|nr:VOC family protein [Paenibacillus selenitireducens]OPA74601.1 hypothetical protein BVG16_22820 [Paenibacillus selenitireducens]
MTVNYLGAVFVHVSNLEQSIAFYSDVLGLALRDVEQWDEGRGANYRIGEHSPLLTLIEDRDFQIYEQPVFNLNCSHVLDLYEKFTQQGIKVGPLHNWSSARNVHLDFDIYDPDGHAINLIEWHERTDIND